MMRSIFAASLMVAASSPFCLAEEVKLETENQKVSYLAGRNLVKVMKWQANEFGLKYKFDFDSVLEGFDAARAGTKSKIAEADVDALTLILRKEAEARAAVNALRKKLKEQADADAGAEIQKEADADAGAEIQKVSYLVGRQLVGHLKGEEREFDIAFDFDTVLAGFKEANAGTESKIAEADVRDFWTKKVQERDAKKEAKRDAEQKAMAAEAQLNIEAGKKFLEENKNREGVTVTESGLQYKVLKKAEGAKPVYNGFVKAHYNGTLINGTVLDGSVDRGEPTELPVAGVFRGLSEGIQLMSVGSKFKFFIPSDLAYGVDSFPPEIGPGQTLIYEVELIQIFSPSEFEEYEKSKLSKESKE